MAADGPVATEMAALSVEDRETRRAYYARRVELFEKYKARMDEATAAARAAATPIAVTLPDGAVKEGIKGVTTPLEIATGISKSLAKKVLVAKVDGEYWDLFRPLEGDCKLELFTFDSPEGKHAFWHSSAHLLGSALETEFGADLTVGPPIENGFYYDCSLRGATIGDEDRARLRAAVDKVIKSKDRFERAEISRAEALDLFRENKFKQELISALPEDSRITTYRVGDMVDLCRGPHVPDAGVIKAVDLYKASAAHWRADVTKDALQRVYGISFPDPKQLAAHQRAVEEAKKRDHRVLGAKYELFFFHELSPGSCFFLPAGARVYNELVSFIRDKYWEFAFEEVVTPNIFNMDLWATSGHADHYKQNMFCFEIEKGEYGLKPMNCPGHCLAFGSRTRSYRDLPIRMADFGVLHRNEFSGALSGLTRVRRFQQDDAHVFCRPDQVADEVRRNLAMLEEVYEVLGLTYAAKLSTRPDDFMGEPALWDEAEAALKAALDGTGREWELNEGDGAFYGPKIDITVFDALKRPFQCATVQLDFQLPIRFGLHYAAEDGSQGRPVIVHRAVLGSVERMFAILLEHYAGKWPLWLSPRQVAIVPISENALGYANDVRDRLRKARFHADVDTTAAKMQKKVRDAQLAQYNYILVVGQAEKDAQTVNVRTRDNKVLGMHKLEDFTQAIERERATKALNSSVAETLGAGIGADRGNKDAQA